MRRALSSPNTLTARCRPSKYPSTRLRNNHSIAPLLSTLPPKPATNELGSLIQRSIEATGPISVARYMKLCLSHPQLGYYMNQKVFGKEGDFITSPEISQAFGEVLGIWFLSRWMEDGCPKKTRLIELGPGRGTLMDDILRTMLTSETFRASLVGVDLIETSKKLRKTQRLKLEKHRVPLEWRDTLSWAEKDTSYTLIVAHEFFDAMPIRVFQKTETGYHEVLVSVDSQGDVASQTSKTTIPSLPSPPKFRYTLSAERTPSEVTVTTSSPRFRNLPVGSRIEVSPASWWIGREIRSRLVGPTYNRGAALIIDYGDDRVFGDSFRGFQNHKPVDVFHEPGRSDLTANVDFRYLREALSGKGLSMGLMSQRDFLLKMGIEVRAKKLLENAPPERQDDIKSAINRLISPFGMGREYKVFMATPSKAAYPFDVKVD